MSTPTLEHRIPTAEEYSRLRASVGWRALPEPAMARGLPGSLHAVCARNDDETVAMGRIVGDGGVYFYLQDVIVVPAWQGRGLGRRIVEELLAWIRANAPPGAWIGLMAAAGKADFYLPFGFVRRADDAPGMYRFVD